MTATATLGGPQRQLRAVRRILASVARLESIIRDLLV
jgi:hypothetical protein